MLVSLLYTFKCVFLAVSCHLRVCLRLRAPERRSECMYASVRV